MSINFGPSLGQGKYICELCNSHHEIHPDDLKPRTGFLYRPTEVSQFVMFVRYLQSWP